MIKIEKADVFGFEGAIRGMRNPMNSWDKSDSVEGCRCEETDTTYVFPFCGEDCIEGCKLVIGKNDLKLMQNLSKAGTDHGKFLRYITVQADITAPLYWYKEYDTYKVGTVANSCSTMHKIHSKEFTLDDFSCEHIGNVPNCDPVYYTALEGVVMALNEARRCYLDTKDKSYWWQMIQLLPSSYNQKRTVQLNYQVLKTMYHARRNHKLDEWHDFCEWCESLPYFKEICIEIGE